MLNITDFPKRLTLIVDVFTKLKAKYKIQKYTIYLVFR